MTPSAIARSVATVSPLPLRILRHGLTVNVSMCMSACACVLSARHAHMRQTCCTGNVCEEDACANTLVTRAPMSQLLCAVPHAVVLAGFYASGVDASAVNGEAGSMMVYATSAAMCPQRFYCPGGVVNGGANAPNLDNPDGDAHSASAGLFSCREHFGVIMGTLWTEDVRSTSHNQCSELAAKCCVLASARPMDCVVCACFVKRLLHVLPVRPAATSHTCCTVLYLFLPQSCRRGTASPALVLLVLVA